VGVGLILDWLRLAVRAGALELTKTQLTKILALEHLGKAMPVDLDGLTLATTPVQVVGAGVLAALAVLLRQALAATAVCLITAQLLVQV
jgi:hypothetical protein